METPFHLLLLKENYALFNSIANQIDDSLFEAFFNFEDNLYVLNPLMKNSKDLLPISIEHYEEPKVSNNNCKCDKPAKLCVVKFNYDENVFSNNEFLGRSFYRCEILKCNFFRLVDKDGDEEVEEKNEKYFSQLKRVEFGNEVSDNDSKNESETTDEVYTSDESDSNLGLSDSNEDNWKKPGNSSEQ